MFLRQVSIELRKTARHPALWMGLGALLILIGFLMVIRHSQMEYGFMPFESGLGSDLLAGISLVNWTAVIAAHFDLTLVNLPYIALALILAVALRITVLSIAISLGYTQLLEFLFAGIFLGRAQACSGNRDSLWHFLPRFCHLDLSPSGYHCINIITL